MSPKTQETLTSLGLLALRLTAGASLLIAHGWGKLTRFSERAQSFPDPLHVGSPASLALTVFAEAFCALAVALGLGTRLAATVLAFMFGVIVMVIHGSDPYSKRELPLLFGVVFVALILTGAGRFSVDAWIGRKLGKGK